ncbi:MAG: Glycerophosphodiester phosphodiesterase, cytoplasmic [Anaerolineales bacterium]|nr:Glycerophosphodiester phosphodiesterase, cytoplasmic [Anaerolineales bacterium]
MLNDIPSPLILGHRGAKYYAPENTLAAFTRALDQGAHGVELDAKLSADGVVVVHHDETVNRTTNGTGRVTQLSLAQLRELDAGSFFSEKFRGEKIPTLEEVFETIGRRAIINVELTNYFSPGDDLVEKTCHLIRRHALQERVLFSSFNAGNLRKAAHFLPEVSRGLLAREGMIGLWARSFGFNFGDYAALHPYITDVTHQEVQRVHRLKRRINVWTSNREEDTRRLIAWGVDGILTDDPLTTVRVTRELTK